MFRQYGNNRLGQAAVILQALFLSLVAFNLGPRIYNPFGARLPVDDVRLVAPSDTIPSFALNRGTKSFPSEIRAVALGTKVFQPIQLHGVAPAPNRQAPTPLASPLLGSLVIRAPPAVDLV